MARLQILELPEGSGDDRQPFVLVIDQYEPTRYVLGIDQDQPEPVSPFEGIAERIGARAVLVFEETIDIPANDTAAYLAQAEEQAEPDHVDERAIRVEEQLKAFIEKRQAIEQEHKTALLDALGMDRTRDWDDIRNAAAGLRKQRDAQGAALERVRSLHDEPEAMDSQNPDPVGYLHGYRVAISAARRATWDQPTSAEE